MSDWGAPKAADDPYWRDHGKVWVEVAPGRKRIVDLSKPRPEPPKRSDFPAPAIRSDNIDPIVSQADGKTYDTLSGLYKSYRPDGNPQGIRYECVGDDMSSFIHKPPERDERKHHEAIERTLSDFGL